MSKKSKSKTSFKEQTGPFGVGETIEEIKKMSVYEELIQGMGFAELTKDLNDKEKEHVLKEAKLHADSYQEVLDRVVKTLSTPEGKKKFREMALRKARGQ